jgi:hypothetical protein
VVEQALQDWNVSRAIGEDLLKGRKDRPHLTLELTPKGNIIEQKGESCSCRRVREGGKVGEFKKKPCMREREAIDDHQTSVYATCDVTLHLTPDFRGTKF